MKESYTPDFDCWARMDSWKFKEAAMLLQNIDPLMYSHIKFNVSLQKIPPELQSAYKLYLIFQSCNWQFQFTNKLNNDAHPFDILLEAHKKGIAIPDALMKLIQQRIKRELPAESNAKFSIFEEMKNNIETEVTTRERTNLLKTIGILVALLVEEKNKPLFQRGNKTNAYQIAQIIIEKAQAHNINSEGLKSIDRKITEALRLIEEELQEA